MKDWTRIPAPIENETDRRQLAAILTAAGLEVRIVRVKPSEKMAPKRFIEFREAT